MNSHSVVIGVMKGTAAAAAVMLLFGAVLAGSAAAADYGRLDFDGEVERAVLAGRQR